MTAPTEPLYRVPLEAGLWAVALVVLAALVLTAVVRALRPAPLEAPVSCCTPGSMGRHPLGPPGSDGVRRCSCGAVSLVPAEVSTDVELARVLPLAGRTDTREARAVDAATDEWPLPVGVWSTA